MEHRQIYEMRQAGMTLQQIGDTIGKTRERVRQLLKEHYGSTAITNCLSTKELAQRANVSVDFIYKLQKTGVIKPVEGCSKGNRYWSIENLQIIQDKRRCKICNKPLLPGKRFAYCSEDCALIGWKVQWKKSTWRRLNQERLEGKWDAGS